MKEIISEKLKIMNEVPFVKNVLDIACGNGFMAKFFIERGSVVTAIDIEKPTLKHPNFKFTQQDIRDFVFEGSYDLIICSLFLHQFYPAGAEFIINKIKKITSVDGYNLLIYMNNEDNFHKEYPEHFFPTLKEVEKLYDGWNFIYKKNIEFLDKHEDVDEHFHNLGLVLIQKKQ